MALFVTHAGAVSGAEVMLERYLHARAKEHEVLVLSSGPCAAFFAAAGAEVTTLPLFDPVGTVTRNVSPAEAGLAAVRVGKGLPGLARAIRSADHDVVVTNSMKAHALVAELARRLRRAVGIRLHDILVPEASSRTARVLLRRASHAAVSTAAVSRASADAARSIGMVRVAHFYNGVELAPLPERQPSSSLRLLVLSQLARWKGIHHVLDAVAAARDSGLDVSLDVVGEATFGDQRYSDELRRRAAELELIPLVRWHGRQVDPQPFYAQADVFIHLPDAPDPLPTAVIEAQSWALPVIARGSGGVAEIVAHGETGFLVTSLDPVDVARVIMRVADERVRRELGAAARERVERVFSHDRYVEAFDEWLSSIRHARRSW